MILGWVFFIWLLFGIVGHQIDRGLRDGTKFPPLVCLMGLPYFVAVLFICGEQK